MTERLAQEAIAEDDRKRRHRMVGKYHRAFSTPDGRAVLEDLRAQANMLQGPDQIDFTELSKPFSPERYFTRQGVRQLVGWIDWNLKKFEEREDDDG